MNLCRLLFYYISAYCLATVLFVHYTQGVKVIDPDAAIIAKETAKMAEVDREEKAFLAKMRWPRQYRIANK